MHSRSYLKLVVQQKILSVKLGNLRKNYDTFKCLPMFSICAHSLALKYVSDNFLQYVPFEVDKPVKHVQFAVIMLFF